MNHRRYEIRGTYSQTKRKRTTAVYAKTPEQATNLAKQQGFIEPLEIAEIPYNLPTERQIEFARDLKITIPRDASKEDVSALISKKLEYDTDPNPGLYEFADNRGFVFSKYIGKKSLYNLVFSNLETLDKIAFFAFSLYRFLSDDRHANLDTSPYREDFFAFANKNISNTSFVNSMNKYEGNDLRFFGKLTIKDNNSITETHGGSVNTIAYKTTADFLQERFGLQRTRAKTIYKDNKASQLELASSIEKQNATGCASIFLVMLGIPFLIKLLI
jgi:hypothetical protein